MRVKRQKPERHCKVLARPLSNRFKCYRKHAQRSCDFLMNITSFFAPNRFGPLNHAFPRPSALPAHAHIGQAASKHIHLIWIMSHILHLA